MSKLKALPDSVFEAVISGEKDLLAEPNKAMEHLASYCGFVKRREYIRPIVSCYKEAQKLKDSDRDRARRYHDRFVELLVQGHTIPLWMK